MTFRIFKNSTTADASDSNDNFYHIGQGSILPMTGVNLANTNSVYNLGSSSYAWNNAYINSIPTTNLDSNDQTWEFISKTAIEADTTRINITGIAGTDNTYLVNYLFKTSTSTAVTITMYINQFSTAALDTSRIWIQDSTTAVSPAFTLRNKAVLAWNPGNTTTALWIFGQVVLKRYEENLGISMAFVGGEDYVDSQSFSFITFGSTSTNGTISSIQIIPETGNILAGSYVDIWTTTEDASL